MMTRLRNYFLTGLVIAAPVLITMWLIWTLVNWIDAWIKPAIPARYSPDTYLPFAVPGFGLVVALIMFTLIGFLTANFIGRSLVSYGEGLLGRMPIVRSIYRALKQFFETALSDRSRSFQKVALLQFPREGIWSVVLVASEARGEIPNVVAAPGERVYSVFLPPTPAPTAGFLMFVRESDLVMLDMSVEDALKLVISMGLVSPEYPPKPKPPSSRAPAVPARPEPVTPPEAA